MVLLFALFALILGMGISFRFFFESFDLISGDLGDARFNTVILEHTWLWLKGIHPSLFDLPMYYPHPNVYAYSDYLLGSAPIYWLSRFLGVDSIHSFQVWLMAGVALTYVSFFILLKRGFKFDSFFSIVGAYLFSFSVVRMTHIEHAQLSSVFWVILSAYGALKVSRDPKSRLGWIQFALGAVMQFITAFYFFWYWIWTLTVFGVYFAASKERRGVLSKWIHEIDWKTLICTAVASGLLASPFLFHYARAAKEMGIRGWGSISYTLPRIYSWIALPIDHWEWRFLPLKDWIQSLPMVQEHYLSFGLLSWCVFLWALIRVYRRREIRWLAIPIIAMFLFTFSIGRISPWALMTYLFPAGGAIRAIGRIQIFMLMFWIPILLFALKGEKKRWIGLMLAILFTENFYSSTQVFSARLEAAQVESLKKEIPENCKTLAYLPHPQKPIYAEQLNAVRAAFASNRSTINGYSGNQPKGYDLITWAQNLKDRQEPVCVVNPIGGNDLEAK